MNFLKKGFTLAEVLVAMGIVGLISSMTVPMLVQNIEKNKTGAILGKSVEQLEVGFQNVIQKANEHYIDASYSETLAPILPSNLTTDSTESSTNIDDSVVAGENIYKLSPYLGLTTTSVTKKSIRSFDSNSSNDDANSGVDSGKIFKFSSSPAEVALIGWTSDAYGTPDFLGDKDARVGTVYIDVNGFEKSPNILGKDIFLFDLRNDSKLIPHGLSDYTTTCSKGSVGTGTSCAARIVKDGFKITYY